MRQRRRTKSKKKSFKISEHFSKRDFLFRTEEGKDAIRISLGLIGGLELLRSLTRNRINIVKGYMTPDAAEAEGNFKRNFHTQGLAADITVDNMSLQDVFLLAEQVPEFKGIGLNIGDNHVHVDTRKTVERSLWVEENGQIIELTNDLRKKYFKTDTP